MGKVRATPAYYLRSVAASNRTNSSGGIEDVPLRNQNQEGSKILNVSQIGKMEKDEGKERRRKLTAYDVLNDKTKLYVILDDVLKTREGQKALQKLRNTIKEHCQVTNKQKNKNSNEDATCLTKNHLNVDESENFSPVLDFHTPENSLKENLHVIDHFEEDMRKTNLNRNQEEEKDDSAEKENRKPKETREVCVNLTDVIKSKEQNEQKQDILKTNQEEEKMEKVEELPKKPKFRKLYNPNDLSCFYTEEELKER